MREAGLPAGVFNLVFGSGASVGEALINHPDVDGIAFTGSKDVGMRLMREFSAGGKYPKPCFGELGGKNAAIVTASADLDMASEGVMRSAFGLQGQKCSACSRVYVDQRVADKFLELLVTKTRALVIGDPTKREVYMGPVISDNSVKKFDAAVASARATGELLAGGERLTAAPTGPRALRRADHRAPPVGPRALLARAVPPVLGRRHHDVVRSGAGRIEPVGAWTHGRLVLERRA